MSLSSETNPSEEDIIRNSKTNTLYMTDFGEGRFFKVVHEDENGFTTKFASQTMLKVIYLKKQEDIEGFEIIKIVRGAETQKVKLSKFNFAQLRSFLKFINEIDLKNVTERRLKILDGDLDDDSIRQVKGLLAKKGGAELIETLLNEGAITSKDIVNTSFRKKGIEIFNNLIQEPEFWKDYSEGNSVKDKKEEKVWQYFLERNEWIFGYGLDYRYKSILQREASISDSELDGSNTVITDYLLGDKMFTTFVEIKKPSTPLFGKLKNRSGAWTLSHDLMDSVSQILEQKAAGLIKMDKTQFDNEGSEIKQKTYDSKVILIIGNWSEIDGCSTKEQEMKMKTFELFRRDSRNIEIITYDELFERAKYIVEGKIESNNINAIDFEDADLPF